MYKINEENSRFKRGDIYWVDFPTYTEQGSVQGGKRPAVLCQNDKGNEFSGVLQFVAMTSQMTKTRLPQHVLINSENYEGLKMDGIILCEQVISVPKSRVKGYIDTLNSFDTYRLDKAISSSLQLNVANSEIEKELNVIVDGIKELEGFVSRWIQRGNPIRGINIEMIERKELVDKLLNICDKYGAKFYHIYDYKIFDRKLNNIISSNNCTNAI